MVAEMHFEGRRIRVGGSWGSLGAFWEVWGGSWAVLGRSWGVLGRLSEGRWRYLAPTWHRKATRERKNSYPPMLLTPLERKNGAKSRPKGAQREPNGAKMRVKIASKIEIDFQTIFDAKIVRKLIKNQAEHC